MATLTSRDLAQSTAITPTTLIHIVTTADTSQSIAGSSYKAELQQLSSIFSGGSSSFSGGTVTGPTIFTNGLTADTISATTYYNLPVSGLTEGTNISITGNNGNFTISVTGITGGEFTGGTVTGSTTFTNGLTADTISATSITINGVSITGDTFVTGGTYTNGDINFNYNTGGGFTVTGITSSGTTFTGGTVTGPTTFTNGLSTNTISATTYQNLPVSGLTAGTNISLVNNNGNYTIAVTGITGGSSIDPYFNSGSGSTISWDVSGQSTNYEATLTAATTTLNLTGVTNGHYGTIILTQDSVGGRTLSLGTINGASGTHRVANGGGGTVALTINPNAVDILTFTYNGSIMYWTVGNDYT
jgi:hypothetical protein